MAHVELGQMRSGWLHNHSSSSVSPRPLPPPLSPLRSPPPPPPPPLPPPAHLFRRHPCPRSPLVAFPGVRQRRFAHPGQCLVRPGAQLMRWRLHGPSPASTRLNSDQSISP